MFTRLVLAELSNAGGLVVFSDPPHCVCLDGGAAWVLAMFAGVSWLFHPQGVGVSFTVVASL